LATGQALVRLEPTSAIVAGIVPWRIACSVYPAACRGRALAVKHDSDIFLPHPPKSECQDDRPLARRRRTPAGKQCLRRLFETRSKSASAAPASRLPVRTGGTVCRPSASCPMTHLAAMNGLRIRIAEHPLFRRLSRVTVADDIGRLVGNMLRKTLFFSCR